MAEVRVQDKVGWRCGYDRFDRPGGVCGELMATGDACDHAELVHAAKRPFIAVGDFVSIPHLEVVPCVS